jgi:hypothetical protein
MEIHPPIHMKSKQNQDLTEANTAINDQGLTRHEIRIGTGQVAHGLRNIYEAY